MFVLYDLMALGVLLLYAPVYVLKRKFHRGFSARFGALPRRLTAMDRPIWIHAVSVGEAMAARGFIARLRDVYPGKKFVISTVTPTGNKVARSCAAEGDCVTYLPLDFSWVVRSVVRRVRPSAFIIVETELWPNLISTLKKEGVPVMTVNGRISDRSYKGYRRVAFLLRPLLRAMTLLCVQSEEDRRRMIALGADRERIKVTGNLKFDAVRVATAEIKEMDRIHDLGLRPGQQLIVAGSTHPGEEEMVIKAFIRIRSEICGARLLIAPRHPQRAGAVAKLIARYEFEALRLSAVKQHADKIGRRVIYLLDTVGQLMKYYGYADIVFVGGSLVRRGGHNILEPASLGKAVMTGPHMHNFRDIFGLFKERKAVVVVNDAEELQKAAVELLRNPADAELLGRAAADTIRSGGGATEHTVAAIRAAVGGL